MDSILSPAERVLVEALARRGVSPNIRRRAQLLLLYDEGLQTKEVAARVDLSRGRARYWRRRFQEKRMDIFPAETGVEIQPVVTKAGQETQVPATEEGLPELPQAKAEFQAQDLPEEDRTGTPEAAPLNQEQAPVDDLAEPAGKTMPSGLNVADLHRLYHPDSQRARHVHDLALALFNGTQTSHQLEDGHRRLLATAAMLHGLSIPEEAGQSKKGSRDFLQIYRPVDLSESEHAIVARIIKYTNGKIPRQARDSVSLLEVQDQDALTLAAILRIALTLDKSGSQETSILAVESEAQHMRLLVSGPQAASDARAARQKSKLWERLFQQKVDIQVVTEEHAEFGETEDLASLLHLRKPGVEAEDPLAEAGRKILRYHFAEMLRHEEGTRQGEDIEELHDMRVATRRMRAAFEVFGEAFEPKVLKAHLKGLRATGRALGRVRDLDVFMEKAQHYLETLPQDHRQGLDPLLSGWQQEREFARDEMIAHLDSEAYKTFKRKFFVFLNTPGMGASRLSTDVPSPHLVKHVAPVLIYTNLASVRAYNSILEMASIEQLHNLRIEFKKLRYTVEFFQEVLGAEAKAVINEIKAMQDHLGDLNDAQVACQILREFLDHWELTQSGLPMLVRQNPQPVVGYLAAKHAERHQLMMAFPKAWERFDRTELRRDLALAIAEL